MVDKFEDIWVIFDHNAYWISKACMSFWITLLIVGVGAGTELANWILAFVWIIVKKIWW